MQSICFTEVTGLVRNKFVTSFFANFYSTKNGNPRNNAFVLPAGVTVFKTEFLKFF